MALISPMAQRGVCPARLSRPLQTTALSCDLFNKRAQAPGRIKPCLGCCPAPNLGLFISLSAFLTGFDLQRVQTQELCVCAFAALVSTGTQHVPNGQKYKMSSKCVLYLSGSHVNLQIKGQSERRQTSV